MSLMRRGLAGVCVCFVSVCVSTIYASSSPGSTSSRFPPIPSHPMHRHDASHHQVPVAQVDGGTFHSVPWGPLCAAPREDPLPGGTYKGAWTWQTTRIQSCCPLPHSTLPVTPQKGQRIYTVTGPDLWRALRS